MRKVIAILAGLAVMATTNYTIHSRERQLVDGAVVLSQRGEDFELHIGQDASIGYLYHTTDKIALYLQESMTFRTLSPEAAIPLKYARVQGKRK